MAMACLSVYKEDVGVATVCANPIHFENPPTIQDNARLSFTVLEADASALKTMIGSEQLLVLESQGFWGKVLSLEPGLILYGRPALKGELFVRSVLTTYGKATN